MLSGAVYKPELSIVPIPGGLNDHATDWPAAVVSLAVNCRVCEAAMEAMFGTITIGCSTVRGICRPLIVIWVNPGPTAVINPLVLTVATVGSFEA